MATSRVMTLPLIPIRDVVVFPQTMFPFIIGRESSVKALEYALRNERYLFLATQKDPATDEPQADDIHAVGTMALIIQNLKLPDGNIKVLVEGLQRGRIVATTHDPGFFMVDVRLLEPEQVDPDRAEALREQLLEAFGEYVKINPSFNADAMNRVIKGPDLNKVADTISGNIPIGIKEKQELLEIDHPEERFGKIIELIRFEIEKPQAGQIDPGPGPEQMEKAQKEYYLHEKIRAIQKELGEDQQTSEIDELKDKVAKAGMTKDAEAKVLKEIRRLEAMPSMSAESTVSRNYVDWLLSLPWEKKSREIRDIAKAEKILEADHYGLDKIKERILEYLAVRQMSRKSQGSILCFVGPPGVGKTSLGRSIARATGRQFVRLSLGGVRDEAEIRGHRRTYIGAFPGQIIQMMKKAGTQNPVFVLDEVDKMSVDFRGDPSSALLEVLDPEQNSHFLDHFVDTEYDLSRVMFICTANVLHAIPRPLQDRMEILEISGYTEREKLEIAKRFLVHKQREASGLSERQIVFTDEALLGIIRHYTRESGVRNLEREIGRVCRRWSARSSPRAAPTGWRWTRRCWRSFSAPIVPCRSREGEDGGGGHRHGLDRHGRRDPAHRSHPDARHRQADRDGQDRRGDAGVGPRRASYVRSRAENFTSPPIFTRTRISTCTSRRGPSPRTVPAPGSPWPRPSSRP